MVREFTPEEKLKITQLREKLSNISNEKHKSLIQDDYYLIRWLRARNLDLEKAEDMLRASLRWREENNVDRILEEESDDVPIRYRRLYATAYFGEDIEGNPILCVPLGRFRHRLAVEEVGFKTYVRYNIYWMETAMAMLSDKEKELGKKGLQLIEIMDMEHYSFKELSYKPGRDFMVETQKIMEAHYPEILKSMMIINTPKIFALAFKIVKPLLPRETLDKMDIYGQNEDEWKEVIQRRFNPDKIPVRWGGNLEASDPFGSQNLDVWPDGPMSLSYFTDDAVDEDGFQKVKVGARDKFKLSVDVEIPGSELRWRFSTEGHDIGFQVTCPNGKTPVPWSRLDSHNFMQQGSIHCQKAGSYGLLFDNSFSYTKSKMLKYDVAIVEPNDLGAENGSFDENDNEDD